MKTPEGVIRRGTSEGVIRRGTSEGVIRRGNQKGYIRRGNQKGYIRRGTSEGVHQRWTDNTMAKRKRTKGQTPSNKQTNCLCYIFFNSKLMFTPWMKKLIDNTTWLPL